MKQKKRVSLLLIRHASAEPRELFSPETDEQRPLTAEGEMECKKLSQFLSRHRFQISSLISSPYLRTQQTAQLLIEHWTIPPPKLLSTDLLKPDQDFKKLNEFLNHLDTQDIALVGHEPLLSTYGGWLIGSKKSRFKLEKSGIALIESQPSLFKGSGTLKWLVPRAGLS